MELINHSKHYLGSIAARFSSFLSASGLTRLYNYHSQLVHLTRARVKSIKDTRAMTSTITTSTAFHWANVQEPLILSTLFSIVYAVLHITVHWTITRPLLLRHRSVKELGSSRTKEANVFSSVAAPLLATSTDAQSIATQDAQSTATEECEWHMPELTWQQRVNLTQK